MSTISQVDYGLYGLGPKNERLVDTLAALRESGIVARLVLDGPMNGEAFLAYVQQMLHPELKRGDVVVMDNPPPTRSAAFRRRSARPAPA